VWPGAPSAAGFSLPAALRDSFRRGRHPLWRPLDRSFQRAQLLLVLGLLGALLFGCGVVGHGVGAADRQAKAESARLHPTDARVVGPARPDATGVATRYRTGELVRVAWSYPDHHPRSARIELVRPADQGSTLPIWVTDDGLLADAPRDTGTFVLLALGTGTAAWLALSAAVLAVYGLYRRLLNHRVQRFWAAGWAAVEPDWSGRLHGDRS
jgi:hypothetical protein